MRKEPLLIAVFASMLCGVPGTMRAQQAESTAPGQQQAPAVKEFQGLEDQWSVAVMKNDQYTMEFLLSPLYVDISSTGDVTTRNQQIASLFQKGDVPVSMLQRVVSVREFGDTAIVSGTYIIKWRTNGSLKEERGIFTHIYNPVSYTHLGSAHRVLGIGANQVEGPRKRGPFVFLRLSGVSTQAGTNFAIEA